LRKIRDSVKDCLHLKFMNWAPVFNRLVDSSVWDEPLHVRVLWVTLLALKEKDDTVWDYDAYRLHKRANLTVEQVEDGLRVLSSPDKKRPGQVNDGIRIQRVVSEDGLHEGWFVVNGAFYRDLMKKLKRKEDQAEHMRQKRLIMRSRPTPAEEMAANMRAAGHTEAEIEAAIGAMPDGKFPESLTHKPDGGKKNGGGLEAEFDGEKED
jgi:hypothetical protein